MNNPCEACAAQRRRSDFEMKEVCVDPYGQLTFTDACPLLAKYLGYQEGLAEAESRWRVKYSGPLPWPVKLENLPLTSSGNFNDFQSAESKVKAREQEIVQFVERHCKLSMGVTPYDIKQWLKENPNPEVRKE